MNSKIAYVALDFDGVLHHHCAGLKKSDQFNPITGVQFFKKMLEERFPRVSEDLDYFQPEGHLFDRTHHLENLLQRLPMVRIVLATSWRQKVSFDHLPKFLSDEVRERVVGTLDLAEDENVTDGVRGTLMSKWLQEKKESDALWIALDDQPRHYAFHSSHLIRTHWRGMDESTVVTALKKIEEFDGHLVQATTD